MKNPTYQITNLPSSLRSPYRSRCSWKTSNTEDPFGGICYYIFTNTALRGHSNTVCKGARNILGVHPVPASLQTHPDPAKSSSSPAVSSASISPSLAGTWIILIPQCCDHSGKPKFTLFPWNITQWDIISLKKYGWYIFVSHEKDWDSIMQTWPHGNEIPAYIWPCKFNFC